MVEKLKQREYKFYRLLLWKTYFDKGLSLTGYIKYLFAFAGIFNFINGKQAIIFAIFYCLFCFILGYVWFNKGLIMTENEISNVFNPFQREVRDKLKLVSKNKKFK